MYVYKPTSGTVLARVDDAYTRLALENATINHNKYKEDIQRYETLRAGDAVSETQLRDVKIAYETSSNYADLFSPYV